MSGVAYNIAIDNIMHFVPPLHSYDIHVYVHDLKKEKIFVSDRKCACDT